MAEIQHSLPPLPDGIIPAEVVARTEKRWLAAMLAMLAFMMAIVVVTGITKAIRPPSHVETVDPRTLHVSGEFVEGNLGASAAPDGAITVRMVADQYAFAPGCVAVAADTPVTFRLTSADVVHGFLLPATNVNSMVVPGLVSEIRTRFTRPGVYRMPCNEFCGVGHHGMWARIEVVPKEQYRTGTGRAICAQ